MAIEFDITLEGDSETINTVIFEDSENTGSGTGNYHTFLAFGDNDGDEGGFNSDFNDPSNPNINAAKTRTLRVQDLAAVNIGGTFYYEFRVDINEVKSGNNPLISLDQFKLYTSASATITSLTDLGGATLRYDLDNLSDRTVLMKQDSSGGGTDDYSVYVPVNLFAGALPTDFVYLFAQMGAKGGDYEADDGFEEWRALTNDLLPNPQMDITKTVASVDATGNGLADEDGDIINYVISITNTGNVALTGVAIDDQVEAYTSVSVAPQLSGLFNIGDENENGILDPDETWFFAFSYTLTQDDLDNQGGGDGELNNLATGHTNETPDDTDNAVVELVYNPAMQVTKSVDSIDDGDDFGAEDQADSEGDVINYLITIANMGNISLTGVTVDDQVEAYTSNPADPLLTLDGFNVGDTDEDGELDVDEIWSYTSSYTLTQADLDGKGGDDGFLDNLATGDTDQTEEDTEPESVPLVYAPSIEVTKTVDSIDDGADFGAEDQADSEGDVINYLITIANTGNISLTGVTVDDQVEAYTSNPADPVLGLGGFNVGDIDEDGILDVGETWSYNSSYTLTQADLDGKGGGDGVLDNLATGDTDQTEEDTEPASVPLVYQPTIDLEKLVSVNGGTTYFDADSPTGPLAAENVPTIYFKFVVTNTGNVTLNDVEVSDNIFDLDLGAGTSWIVGDLAPGETKELIITAPFVIGQHTNTGTATSDEGATDTDDANYFGVEGPGVRTPGFWQSPFGSQFWDGETGNEAKAGQDGFADGELTYKVDSNGNGSLDSVEKKGLLLGDYDFDGIKDLDETVLFIDLQAAKLLIQSKEKEDDVRWKMGRDAVATWLNYLAGNPIGDDDAGDDAYSPREALDDAIAWLKQYADSGNNGIGFANNKPQFEGSNIKSNSAAWQQDGATFESGSEIHNALDEYNNFGTVNGVPYANDADNSLFITVLGMI